MLLDDEEKGSGRNDPHIVMKNRGLAVHLAVEKQADMMIVHHGSIDEKIHLVAAHRLEGVTDLRSFFRIVMMGREANQFNSSRTAVSSQCSFFGHFEQSLQIFCGNSSLSTVWNPRRWKKWAR